MAPTLNSLLSPFIAWLGREDSNPRSRDQNPLPYHLATPQRAARHGTPDHTSVARRGNGPRAPQAPAACRGLPSARAGAG